MKKSLATLATLTTVATLAASVFMPATASATSYAPVTVPGVPAKTVTTAKGNGPGYTAKFTIPPSAPYWQVNWSYNCRPSGSQGAFDWSVNTPTGLDTNDFITPNQLGWGYSAAERYYDHGTFYLNINADDGCIWSIQVITPATPTYTVRFDQVWRNLAWDNNAFAPGTTPVQVRVSFHNDGPGAVTFTDDLSLVVLSRHSTWTGRPILDDNTYQCDNSQLVIELKLGQTVRPGGSLTGCVVFAVPNRVWWAAPVVPVTLEWVTATKTYQVARFGS